jgi:thiamine pyrophosphokinase
MFFSIKLRKFTALLVVFVMLFAMTAFMANAESGKKADNTFGLGDVAEEIVTTSGSALNIKSENDFIGIINSNTDDDKVFIFEFLVIDDEKVLQVHGLRYNISNVNYPNDYYGNIAVNNRTKGWVGEGYRSGENLGSTVATETYIEYKSDTPFFT